MHSEKKRKLLRGHRRGAWPDTAARKASLSQTQRPWGQGSLQQTPCSGPPLSVPTSSVANTVNAEVGTRELHFPESITTRVKLDSTNQGRSCVIWKFWGFLLVSMVVKMMGLGRDGPGSDFMGLNQQLLQLKWLLIPGSQLKGSALELAVPMVGTDCLLPEGGPGQATFCHDFCNYPGGSTRSPKVAPESLY